MTADVSGPSPVVDLIEHAAAIIVKAREEPHTAPGHWAGALYQAGMLVPPGHARPAAPVNGEAELREQISRAVASAWYNTGDPTVVDAVMAVVQPRLAARDADAEAVERGDALIVSLRQEVDHYYERARRAEVDLAAANERAERRLRETENSWEQLSGEYHAVDARAEQAEARIAAVDAELTRWERHAPDGYPIEPKAIDYANRMRRVINAAVQLAETRFSFGTAAIKERDRAEADLAELRERILDIDAHATPFGDIPDDPGWIGTYLVTAGALHRALGRIGTTAPSCKAEADLAAARQQLDQVQALLDEWERLGRGAGVHGKQLRAVLNVAADETGTRDDE